MRDYIAALNSRDLDAVTRLVSPGCKFIDSQGGFVIGREHCVEASRRFFALDLEYELEAATIVPRAPHVLIAGEMRSSNVRLTRDRLWRARVEGAHLTEWQSFAEGQGLGVARLLMPEVAG